MLGLIAQTMTATAALTAAGSFHDFVLQVVGILAAALATALVAALKAWLKQHGLAVAQSAGVDLAEERIKVALEAHPVVGKILADNGISSASLAAHLDDVVKKGIKAAAEATGVQPTLDALVHSDEVAAVKKITMEAKS